MDCCSNPYTHCLLSFLRRSVRFFSCLLDSRCSQDFTFLHPRKIEICKIIFVNVLQCLFQIPVFWKPGRLFVPYTLFRSMFSAFSRVQQKIPVSKIHVLKMNPVHVFFPPSRYIIMLLINEFFQEDVIHMAEYPRDSFVNRRTGKIIQSRDHKVSRINNFNIYSCPFVPFLLIK